MLLRKKRLYADAAAATPLSKKAEAELRRLLPLFGNPGALHREALSAKEELERARKIIAQTIGAHADEIIFAASGTEANNLAIQGVVRPLLQKFGKLHVITSAVEHQSVLEPLRALEREGLLVTTLPVDAQGLVDPKTLRDAITEKTVFVSVQMVNSEMGAIEPIHELAKEIRHAKRSRTTRSEGKTWPSGPERPSESSAAQRAGGSAPSLPLYFHTDACQAPLWLPVSVEKLGIDLATLDGQKVLGPKGVGALYIKRGASIEAVLWGGRQEKGLRGGTENTPLAGSFAVALAEAQKNVEARALRTAQVRDTLIDELTRLIPDAVIHGPMGARRVANNINVSIPGLSGEMAVVALDAEGIAVSTRSACTIGDEDPSHVIVALGVPKELAKGAIRITLLPDATTADAKRIASKLYEISLRYRTN
jgi:cysteine desulfurase